MGPRFTQPDICSELPANGACVFCTQEAVASISTVFSFYSEKKGSEMDFSAEQD